MVDYAHPLVPGTLVRRYKRFLADVVLDSGETLTAHCANPGSMMGLATPGARVWLEDSRDPKRKLRWSWRLIEVESGTLVGIDTGLANAVVAEAIEAGRIPELTGYHGLRREVRYGANSRVDLLLEDPGACFVEVKSVTLSRRPGLAEFPDAVTARGAKHLRDLSAEVAAGNRAVLLYLVQREDATAFAPAADIDPTYADCFRIARSEGLEALCHACTVTPRGITLGERLPIAGP